MFKSPVGKENCPMSLTDPIADMLTRIRNAAQAKHEKLDVPFSKIKENILKIFKEEGFIKGYNILQDKRTIKVYLKYDEKNTTVIEGLERISKPSRRIYAGKDEIPFVRRGLGITILSTPKGILTDKEARKLGVGGELLCTIW